MPAQLAMMNAADSDRVLVGDLAVERAGLSKAKRGALQPVLYEAADDAGLYRDRVGLVLTFA